MTARVSICTSVLNQSEHLRRAIESVRAQTFTDWEHIIVDDGSTEDIRGLVESFSDARLVYVRLPENRGSCVGYNYAMSLASGEYIEPLAADEFLWERKLEVQVAWMDEHPDIGCTWGLPTPNIGRPWELGGPCPSWEQYHYRAHNRSRQAWIRTLMRFENVPIGGAAMLMRRTCYEAIGGFDPQLNACSDLEWFVRFFQKFDGHILPYRLADAVHPDGRLSALPNAAELFQRDVKILQEKHKLELPPPVGRLSVAIPVRNMAKFIGRTLTSLTEQSFQDFDVLVLDDASEDQADLLAAIEPFRDKLNLNLLRVEENIGVARAQNAMLALAQTEFFALIAADDWLSPDALERIMAEFEADPYLEFAASQTDFYDVDEQPLPAGSNALQKILPASNHSREQWLDQLYYGNNYFGVGIYRTQALKQIGGFTTDDGVLCDYNIYLALLQRENIKIVEQPLTHTRVHDGQRSVGKFDQTWLRNQYHAIKSRYYAPRMKVIICTPFYEMRGFSPYIESLAATIRLLAYHHIDHEFWALPGDSYVDRAKNTIFTKFLEDPAATDLFMIDSDMQWNVQGFWAMLQQPEEILQGSYPQKNGWDKFTAVPEFVEGEDGKHHPIGRVLPGDTAVIKAAFLAGGFLRIKRAALEKYRDAYPEFRYFDQGADPANPEREYVEFFTCERKVHGDALTKDGRPMQLRWGEDRVFGIRMRDIGIDSWIYPNIDFGHFGVKGWTGNFHRYLSEGTGTREAA